MILEILKKRDAKIHFIGVLGAGMYPLFMILKNAGYSLSGSDAVKTPLFDKLQASCERVYIGHKGDFVSEADVVVRSLAVPDSDEEVSLANSLSVPVISRPELLGAIISSFNYSVGVSGSHGKSTVTAMIFEIFIKQGVPATVACGAEIKSKHPEIGKDKDVIIAEACEYKDAFLNFFFDSYVFLNLEYDHTDYFTSFDSLRRSFLLAMKNAQKLIVNKDDPEIYSLAVKSEKDFVTVSVREMADYEARNIDSLFGYYSYDLYLKGIFCHRVKLSVPGAFNVTNSLSAIAAACEFGIDPILAADSLNEFSGVGRRLEFIGRLFGRAVYYDYAHHPTEIRAGIEAVREMQGGSVDVVFRPHTFSRTKSLFGDFASSLSLADRVILLDIDPVREKYDQSISINSLCDKIGEKACVLEFERVIDRLKESSGAIIVMGAANLLPLIKEIKNNLEK